MNSSRRNQPRQPAPVTRSNPLARGLVGFWYPVGGRFVSAVPGVQHAAMISGARLKPMPPADLGLTTTSTSNDAATIPYDARYYPTSAFTVVADITAPSDFSSWPVLIDCDPGSTGWGFYTDGSANIVRAYARIIGQFSGDTWVDLGTSVAPGQRASLGFTSDGKQQYVTVNGAVVASNPEPGPLNLGTEPIHLLKGASTGPLRYLAIWNRGLSTAEHRLFYANPWQVLAPAQRSIFVSLAGPAAALASSATASAAATAALTTKIQLAGSPACGASTSAALTTGIRLGAAAAASASSASQLATSIKLTAAVGGAATSAASLSASIRLVASSSAGSSASAALSTGIRLASSSVAAANAGAALTTSITLQAGATAGAAATADLTVGDAIDLAAAAIAQAGSTAALSTSIRLAASAAAASQATAELLTAIRLSATAQSVAQASAALSAAGPVDLEAEAAALATASAVLTTQILLAAAAGMSCDVTANLSAQGRPVFGALPTDWQPHHSPRPAAVSDASRPTQASADRPPSLSQGRRQ